MAVPGEPEHEWASTGANRLKGRGCPRCKKHLRSVLEVVPRLRAAELVPASTHRRRTEATVVIDDVVRHVDMLLAGANSRASSSRSTAATATPAQAELDRDTARPRLLAGAGYRVLRVREHPLEAITEHDVLVPTDATVKQTTDAVLRGCVTSAGCAWSTSTATSRARTAPRRRRDGLLRAERPGKSVRLPGPPTFTRDERWDEGLAAWPRSSLAKGTRTCRASTSRTAHRSGSGWREARPVRPRPHGARPAAALEALPGWTGTPSRTTGRPATSTSSRSMPVKAHIDVPAHYWDDDGFPLGSWVRSHRRPGGRRTMTDAPARPTRGGARLDVHPAHRGRVGTRRTPPSRHSPTGRGTAACRPNTARTTSTSTPGLAVNGPSSTEGASSPTGQSGSRPSRAGRGTPWTPPGTAATTSSPATPPRPVQRPFAATSSSTGTPSARGSESNAPACARGPSSPRGAPA